MDFHDPTHTHALQLGLQTGLPIDRIRRHGRDAVGKLQQFLFQAAEGLFHQLLDVAGHRELFLVELVADQCDHLPAESDVKHADDEQNQDGPGNDEPSGPITGIEA